MVWLTIIFMSLSRIVLGMNSFRCSEVDIDSRSFVGSYWRTLWGELYTNWLCWWKHNESFISTHWKWQCRSLLPLDYTEVVEAHYDKSVISLSDILDVFFENHDYTTLYPKRYASAIYYTEDEQREEAESVIKYTLVGNAGIVWYRRVMSQRRFFHCTIMWMRNICSTSTISRIHQQWCFSCCMNTTGIFEHGSLNLTYFLLWQSSHSSLCLPTDSMLVFLDSMTWIMWAKFSTVLTCLIISSWSVSCGLPELDLSVCFYDWA